MTALSANDAWSVGIWRDNPAGRGPLVLRWNGLVWSLTDLPETSQLGSYPETEGVDAAPNGDVWLVGNVITLFPYNSPLVLRWRGGSWDYVHTVTLRPQTVYPFSPRGGMLHEVDALAPDDIWAVGLADGFGVGATSVPLAAHWDGSSWTDVDVPRLANRHHDLNDVVAISHDDVWAVGDYRNEPGAFHGVTYHWDGHSRSHVDSPIEHMGGDTGLDDVAATGPNDVWAIGGVQGGAVVVMHWNGSQWSIVAAPSNSGGSLAAVGPDDVWASGWNGFWHWDGTTWTEVPASVPGATYVIRNGGMAKVGACDIWSAGFWTLEDGLTSFTLAERLQQAPASVDSRLGAGTSITFPNPYRPGDEIRLAIPPAEAASLTVHDLQGRIVRRLSLESASVGGSQSLSWDGRTDMGGDLPAGIYFLRFEADGMKVNRKLMLLGTVR